jgi:hypothetical protein
MLLFLITSTQLETLHGTLIRMQCERMICRVQLVNLKELARRHD